MSERDRLAADLRDEIIDCGWASCYHPPDAAGNDWLPFCMEAADRLIALGWTNPWGAALADPATKAALDAGLADAAAGHARRVEISGMVVKTSDTVAKAYREDTDADD